MALQNGQRLRALPSFGALGVQLLWLIKETGLGCRGAHAAATLEARWETEAPRGQVICPGHHAGKCWSHDPRWAWREEGGSGGQDPGPTGLPTP